MKVSNLILGLITLFIFPSCLRNEKIEEGDVIEIGTTLDIDIYDTIQIEEPDYLYFYDFDQNYFISTEQRPPNILIHDKKGKLVSKFNHYGKGPGEYKSIKKVGWNSKTKEIAVLTRKKLLTYDIKGQLISETKIDFSPSYSVEKLMFWKDKILSLSLANDKYQVATKAFFENTHHVSIVDKLTGKAEHFVPYETGSIFLQNMYNTGHLAIFDQLSNDQLVVGFNYDKNIYIYDIPSKKLVKHFRTYPTHFGTPEPSSDFSPKGMRHSLQKNASYLSISAYNDTIVTFYKQATPKENIKKSVVAMNANTGKKSSYIDLYTTKGEKISKDIELPKGVAFFKFFSRDRILLKRHFAPVNDSEDEGNVLYWARLVEK